jgi:hypothetical protein
MMRNVPVTQAVTLIFVLIVILNLIVLGVLLLASGA